MCTCFICFLLFTLISIDLYLVVVKLNEACYLNDIKRLCREHIYLYKTYFNFWKSGSFIFLIFFWNTVQIIHNNNTPWCKRGDSMFDVTMGSFDGAEICDLSRTNFLLSQLQHLEINVGLYRDDGLAVCFQAT